MPEKLVVNVDLRHPDSEALDEMDRLFRTFVAETCEAKNLLGRVEEFWHMPVTEFDADCVDAVRSATVELGLFEHGDGQRRHTMLSTWRKLHLPA